MSLPKLVQLAFPFVAGGAVAIFVTELSRSPAVPRGEPFTEAWFREAARPPEHLWSGEPIFDWGD